MPVLELTGLQLAGKRVLIRQDLNVPVKDGVVTSDQRILASLPTIRHCIEAGAQLMIMSHLGRPEEGVSEARFSLQPVASYLADALGKDVPLVRDYLQQAPDLDNGDVVLLENVRFNVGEKANDESLSRQYAALCDIFVMDAFGTAHRAQASTHGAGEYAPVACGGIANTFIAAAGFKVGKSLVEVDLIPAAKRLVEQAKQQGRDIPIPVDVVCGKEFSENAAAVIKAVDQVEDDDMIFDIGPQTAVQFATILQQAATIVWNGPVGVFEFDQFAEGTRVVSQAIAASPAFSIAGGGDTLAAVDKYGITQQVSYISTGGGAFLEFLEGKQLPAVAMLEQRYEDYERSNS